MVGGARLRVRRVARCVSLDVVRGAVNGGLWANRVIVETAAGLL